MDPRAVVSEVEASAHALEAGPGFPAGYVERARAAAGALTPFCPLEDDVMAASRDLEMHKGVEPGGPGTTASWLRRPGQRLTGRLIDWYLNFLHQQVRELGPAAARFGEAVNARLDRVEGRQVAGRDRFRTDVSALRTRVDGLEHRLGARRPGRDSGPTPSP
ncbi:MAG TPA: hypothetical protein VGL92_00235 [Acidimicrobiia bacterium]